MAYILVELGYGHVKINGSKVTASCTCAPNKDDHSFGVLVDGKWPGYYCHRCKVRGSVANLVWKTWWTGQKAPKSLKIVMAHEIDYWCRDEDAGPRKLEYAPLADRPRVVDASEPSPRFTTGVQLDLQGKVQIVPPPKPITEGDLGRFAPGPSLYLLKRGVTRDTQLAYDVRGNPWTRRVVFPIRTWDGTLVGWSQRRTQEGDSCWKCGVDVVNRKLLAENGERDLLNQCPTCGTFYAKYMHARGFLRNKQFYGEWLRGTTPDPKTVPVLVEGMTDVQNLYQCGIRPPLALPLGIMGGKPGADQIDRLLRSFPDGPIFVLRDHDDPTLYPLLPDGVAPGDEMAAATRRMVCARDPTRDVVDIVPPAFLDPGELTQEHADAVRDIIQERVAGGDSVASIFKL